MAVRTNCTMSLARNGRLEALKPPLQHRLRTRSCSFQISTHATKNVPSMFPHGGKTKWWLLHVKRWEEIFVRILLCNIYCTNAETPYLFFLEHTVVYIFTVCLKEIYRPYWHGVVSDLNFVQGYKLSKVGIRYSFNHTVLYVTLFFKLVELVMYTSVDSVHNIISYNYVQ